MQTPRVTPVVTQLAQQVRAFAQPREDARIVVIRVGVHVCLDVDVLTLEYDGGCVEASVAVGEEAGQELPARFEHAADAAHATGDVVEGDVREDGLREGKVECLMHVPEFEIATGNQHRVFTLDSLLLQFTAAGNKKVFTDVRAEVTALSQVIDEMYPGAQAAAADVEQIMLRLQALVHERVELKLPHPLPLASDRFTVPVG